MKIEDIKNISAEECEARLAEIKTEMNAEDANIEELSAEVDAIEERRKALIEAEEQRKALAQKVATSATATIIESRKEEKKMEKTEIRNSAEYINAYAEYIKTEDDAECRALLTENVNGGTVPVPEFVYDIVKTAWEREGIMSRVRKTYLKGNLKVGFEISADPAVVHTEGDVAVAEEDLTLGVVELVPASIKKWISVSDEVVDMRGEDFLRYIYDELTYQIAKKASDLLIDRIVASPATSSASAPAVPVVSASALAMGTIAEALGNLSDQTSNNVVVMNKATWSAFKAVQYANGFNADPFEGLTVVFSNHLKSFASASAGDTVIIVGDFGEGAIANLPNGEGIAFKFDDKTDMTKDLVRILGRQYIGLGVVAPSAFVKINKA
jgi:HK97 family phage major capsid protein